MAAGKASAWRISSTPRCCRTASCPTAPSSPTTPSTTTSARPQSDPLIPFSLTPISYIPPTEERAPQGVLSSVSVCLSSVDTFSFSPSQREMGSLRFLRFSVASAPISPRIFSKLPIPRIRKPNINISYPSLSTRLFAKIFVSRTDFLHEIVKKYFRFFQTLQNIVNCLTSQKLHLHFVKNSTIHLV